MALHLDFFFEHDIPLVSHQLGGPVITLDGEAVGMTTAWTMYGSKAVPADVIERLLPKLIESAKRH